MSGEVIFALTITQAAALGAIALGERIRAASPAERDRIVEGLQRKGLVMANGDGAVELTDLGSSAAALCARLQLVKLNGRATGR